MRKNTHKRWLRVTAIGIGGFGPIFSLGTMPATREPARWSLDLLSWPVDGATTLTNPDAVFLLALTGGFLLGWGVAVWLMTAHLFDCAPDAVRRCVLGGLCAWFVLDSAGSIASGNASNALFNIAVLLVLAGPLWWRAEDAAVD
jgi:biotin transporter BioY